MNKSNFGFRMIARALCLIMIVCSIATLPVISFGATPTTLSGYINGTDDTAGSWALEEITAGSSYRLTITGVTGMLGKTNKPWETAGFASDAEAKASITEVVIGDGVTSVQDNVFNNYTKLTKVTFPETGLTTLNAYSFTSCPVTTAINTATITTIGEAGIAGWKLANISQFESLEKIGGRCMTAFTGAVQTFPASIREIISPFAYAQPNIETVDLSACDGTLVFKEYAVGVFGEMKKLKTVKMPKTADLSNLTKSMTTSVNSGCATTFGMIVPADYTYAEALTAFVENKTYHPTADVKPCLIDEAPADATGTWTHGTSIIDGKYVYDDTNKVLTLYGHGTIPYSQDSVNAADKPWYSKMGEIKKIVFKNGITNVGQYMFAKNNAGTGAGYTALEELEFADSVKSITMWAFQDAGIKKITGGRNITSIGDCAFLGSTLSTFDNFESLTTMGARNLAGLKTDYYKVPSGITNMNSWFLYGSSTLKVVDMTDCASVVLNEASLAGLQEGTVVMLPMDTSIAAATTNLMSTVQDADKNRHVIMMLPEGYKETEKGKALLANLATDSIYRNGFDNTPYIAEYTTGIVKAPTDATAIPGVKNGAYKVTGTKLEIWGIGSLAGTTDLLWSQAQADYQPWGTEVASGITEVVVYGGVTRIPQNMFTAAVQNEKFGGFSALKKVTLPETLTYIGNQSFQAPVDDINLDETNVYKIESNAFTNSGLIGTLRFPDTIKSIAAGAFNNTKLDRIMFEEGACNVEFGQYSFQTPWNEPLEYIQIPAGSKVDSAGTLGPFTQVRAGCTVVFMGDVPASFKDGATKLFGDDADMPNVVIQDNVTLSEDDKTAMQAQGFSGSFRIAELAGEVEVGDAALGKLTLVNDKDEEQDYVLLYAGYKNNMLVDLHISTDGKVPAFGVEEDITARLDETKEYDTFKWFVWTSKTGIQPYRTR